MFSITKKKLNIVALFYLQCRYLCNKFIGSNLKKIEPSWKNVSFHHILKEECVQICCNLLKCSVFWYTLHTAGKKMYLYIVYYYHMCQTEVSFVTFQKNIGSFQEGTYHSLCMFAIFIFKFNHHLSLIFLGEIERNLER